MINKTCSIGACIHISHVTWITLYNVESWKQFGTDQWPQQMTNECLDSSTYTINEVNCVQCRVQYTSDDISFYSISFRSVLSCPVLFCYVMLCSILFGRWCACVCGCYITNCTIVITIKCLHHFLFLFSVVFLFVVIAICLKVAIFAHDILSK